MTQQYQRHYYQKNKTRLNQRQKERRAQQAAQRPPKPPKEPSMTSTDPEIRSGYRDPDQYEELPPDAHEWEDYSKLYERAAKSGNPAMVAIARAEMQRLAQKYNIDLSNLPLPESTARILPSKVKRPHMLDIDSLMAARVVIERD